MSNRRGVARRLGAAALLAATLVPAALDGVGFARRADAADEVPLDRFFKGAVIGLDGSKVRLRYDFSSKEQAADWPAGQPFNVVPNPQNSTVIDDGKIFVRGMIGIRHVAEWEGDLTVTCRLVPDGVKDIGSYVSGGSEQPEDYVTYSIGERYWHNWDNHAGGNTGMMKFGKQYAETSGGYTGFRYLAERKPSTDVVAGKPVVWSFGRKGTDLFLVLNDMRLESVELPIPLRTLQPGFYAINSSVGVDDVVVEGTLAPRYVAAKKIALLTHNPIAPPEPASAGDPAVKALLDGYRAGRENAAKVVAVVADAARTDGDRAAAVSALKVGPRKALTTVVDLLYSEDLKSRVWGIEIVKAMTGKSYGYEPRSGEKSRKSAVAKLNADVAAHPELLKGGGG